MSHAEHTALVTGANSGLGFEAAAQLAEAGWGTVVLACRTVEKAEAARKQLVERVGRDPFQALAVDTSEVASANAAADALVERGTRIDFLLLNAGASGKEPSFNADGIEITYASTLVGHHVLTMRALADDLLAPEARIVIAGSEGARGGVPGMAVHDVAKIAADSFDGDTVAAIEALFRLKAPSQGNGFSNMSEYVTAKLVVAWWAGALARRLPAGMAVNAVSPGSVASTSFGRDAPAVMKLIMLPMMKLIGPLMGMNGPIGQGAARYLAVADYPAEHTGHFYATAHLKKLVGPIGIQTVPAYFVDEALQEAGFEAVVRLTGVGVPRDEAEAATA